MKAKSFKKRPYKKITEKLFAQTLSLAFIAILVVMIIRSAGQGKIGNMFTNLLSLILKVDWDTARHIYMINIRQNISYIMLGTILFFFLFFIRLMFSWFTNYFDEIIDGVNQLASGKKKTIALSPELDFLSVQLNKVNDELIRSAEAEREAEKRKNDLIVYLAHDINTPLTSIIGYLSLLDEVPDMSTEQKEKNIRITLEKAQRLETLINEFFDIARYNMSEITLYKEVIDLSYMMMQIADEAYPLLASNQKTVTINIPEDLTVYADSGKMARVFNNVLRNAIIYSTTGSKIQISGQSMEDRVVIYFENAGIIPQDKLVSIFEKFYRLDEARQTTTGGAGLGLAIAKDIVTLHGGAITAVSENGSTVFTISLPIK